MSVSLHIYIEDGTRVFSAGNERISPPSDTFRKYYTELYVDTAIPELTAYVSAETSLVNTGRCENLFFRYRPEQRSGLLNEFCDIFSTNVQENISEGVESSVRDAQNRGLPKNLVRSGLFKEGWEYERDVSTGHIPRLLDQVNPRLPGLDDLEKKAVKELFPGDTQLEFGVRTLQDGLQIVHWVVQNRTDCQVVLGSNPNVSSISADMCLITGQESNFDPRGSTEEIYINQVNKKQESWQEDRKETSHELIDNLIDKKRSGHRVYIELNSLQEYINYDEKVNLQMDVARDILEHYDRVLDDAYLDQNNKMSVIDDLSKRIEDEQNELIEQLRDSALEKFEDEIDRSFGTTVTADLQLYRWYNDIETILADPDTPAVGGDDSRVQEFQQNWQDWIANQNVDDDIKRVVRKELQSTVEGEKSKLERSLPPQIKRACNDAANIVEKESDRRGKERERLYTLREMLDNPDVDIGSNPRREIGTIQEVFEFIDKHSYTTEFYNVARNTLSERIRECYTAEIKNRLGTYLGRLEDEPSRQADFLDAIRTVNSAGSVYNETADHSAEEQQLMQLVAGAHEDRYIAGEQEDILRDEIEEYIQSCIGSLEADYEDKIDDILTDIDEDRRYQYKIQVDIFTKMLALLDNPFTTNESTFPEVRRFHTVWRDVVENDIVSDEWQTEQKRKRRAEFSRNKEDAEDFITDGSSQVAGISYRTISIGLSGVVLLLLLGVLLIGGFVPQGSMSDSAPPVELETPVAGEEITGDGISVSGQATADRVDLIFISRYSDLREIRTVSVTDNRFETEVSSLPIGDYRLVAVANETALLDSQRADSGTDDGEGDSDGLDDTTGGKVGGGDGSSNDTGTDDRMDGGADNGTDDNRGNGTDGGADNGTGDNRENGTDGKGGGDVVANKDATSGAEELSVVQNNQNRSNTTEDSSRESSTDGGDGVLSNRTEQEAMAVTSFSYVGNSPIIQISETRYSNDSSAIIVSGDFSASIGNATVSVYNLNGRIVGARSQSLSSTETDDTFEIGINGEGPYIIELAPTHSSGSDLLDRQIFELPDEALRGEQ